MPFWDQRLTLLYLERFVQLQPTFAASSVAKRQSGSCYLRQSDLALKLPWKFQNSSNGRRAAPNERKDSISSEWHFHTRCSRWPETDYIQTQYLELRKGAGKPISRRKAKHQ